MALKVESSFDKGTNQAKVKRMSSFVCVVFHGNREDISKKRSVQFIRRFKVKA